MTQSSRLEVMILETIQQNKEQFNKTMNNSIKTGTDRHLRHNGARRHVHTYTNIHSHTHAKQKTDRVINKEKKQTKRAIIISKSKKITRKKENNNNNNENKRLGSTTEKNTHQYNIQSGRSEQDQPASLILDSTCAMEQAGSHQYY